MWFGNENLFSNFLRVSPQFSPNWLSQPLLAILTHYFGPFVCEKILLSIYVAGFACAFRYMVFSIATISKWISLLGFIFIYNTTFIYGFFNFNFGLVFLLLCIGAFNRYIRNRSSGNFILVFALPLFLYASHLVAVSVYFLYVLVYVVITSAMDLLKKKRLWWMQARVFFSLITAFIFPIMLVVTYLTDDKESNDLFFLSNPEIWNDIVIQSGNFCFGKHEQGYTRWNYYTVIGGLLLSVLIFLFYRKKQSWKFGDVFQYDTNVLIAICFSLALCICAFVLPDSSAGGGGMLTVRLVFLTTTFIMVSFFLLIKVNAVLVAMIVLVNIVSIDKLMYVTRNQTEQQDFCRSIENVSDFVDSNGVLVYLDYRQSFPLGHYSKILATEHNLIAMDNLGAHKAFSPIQWIPSLRKNDDMLCWVGNQWNCTENNLPPVLRNRDLYVLVNGVCSDHENGNVNCEAWQEFLNGSCIQVYGDDHGLSLYKRSY